MSQKNKSCASVWTIARINSIQKKWTSSFMSTQNNSVSSSGSKNQQLETWPQNALSANLNSKLIRLRLQGMNLTKWDKKAEPRVRWCLVGVWLRLQCNSAPLATLKRGAGGPWTNGSVKRTWNCEMAPKARRPPQSPWKPGSTKNQWAMHLKNPQFNG